MALKKSELYSSLWAGCDELRGGMDSSQYKDYVLVLLFIKYISDKYSGIAYAPITVPKGASFKDMVALKGKPSIGDDINKKIIAPLAEANNLSDMPDFNDVSKLGSGKEMVDRLTNLIAIFENTALDFSKNRAEGDDILGDAYEYLMRHFAQESGKSKGQFYTPAEVSRVIAKIIGITNDDNITSSTTAYDPTCGSGSLLLKVAEEADIKISLFGQEKDSATSNLGRMNMILHAHPTAVIRQGNTLSNPFFKDNNGSLKLFDYIVANPPFSDKRWATGVNIINGNDDYDRFRGYGIPPSKNGDYAYLLHIIRSLKIKGKGACILPHGVLFRGNVEAEIRRNIIRKGYIKGIIGLPANLFYGTGIPACIIVIDKEKAKNRKGIFMIDAGKGFIKDGNKNRLRSRDIHKIVDVFNKQIEIEKYSRMVLLSEIEKNEFNLNIPRYIDNQEPEDIHDIEAHLLGDIPKSDIKALDNYWKIFPGLKTKLFGKTERSNYLSLKLEKDKIKETIYKHQKFISYIEKMNTVFSKWKKESISYLKNINIGCKPKAIICELSEKLLKKYAGKDLIDKYDVYQHLMNFWEDVMQDDCYLIASEGWKAEPYCIIEKNKKGKKVDKGWACDIAPKMFVISHFFADEKKNIETLESELEIIAGQIVEIEEEQNSEKGYFADMDKVNKNSIRLRLKEIKQDIDAEDELKVLKEYMDLIEKQADLKKRIKAAASELDKIVLERYKTLTEDEIKILVVDDKWMPKIENDIKSEIDRISQHLTQRIKKLAQRYETPLPEQTSHVAELEKKVKKHLKKMGFQT